MVLALAYFIVVLIAVLAHCRNYGMLIESKVPAMPVQKLENNTDFQRNAKIINMAGTLEIVLLIVIFIDLIVKLVNDYNVKKTDISCNKV